MKRILYIYDLIRILSIDVALGGVALSSSIAFVFGVPFPLSAGVALFIAIWIIYTLDHLLDARKLKVTPSMPRHLFHQKYQKSLMIVIFFMTVIGAINLYYLPFEILIFGIGLAFIVGIYFLMSVLLRVFIVKEVFIASVYSTGIFLTPVSLSAFADYSIIYWLVQVFLLALINLFLFSWYEADLDQQDGYHSWTVKYGIDKVRIHLRIIFVLLIALQALTFLFLHSYHTILFQSLLIIMTGILTWIYIATDWFRTNERYRIIGDLIFFIPSLIFWF